MRSYGNAENDQKDDGTGSMEAVYFGNASGGTMNHGGASRGGRFTFAVESH